MTGIAPSRDKVIDIRQAVEALQGAVLDGRQDVMSSESKMASSEQGVTSPEQGVTSPEQGVTSAQREAPEDAQQLDNERGVRNESANKRDESAEQEIQEDADEAKEVRSAKQKVGEEQTGPQQAQGDVVGSAGGESRGEKRVGYSETREEWLDAGKQRARTDYKKDNEKNELEEAGNVRHDMGVKSQGGQAGEVAEGGYEKGENQGGGKEHDAKWVDAGNRRAREDYEPNGKGENESEEAGNVRHDMGDRSGEGQAGEVAEGGYQQGEKQGEGYQQGEKQGEGEEKGGEKFENVKRHPGSGVGEVLRMDDPGKDGPSDMGSEQQGPSDELLGSGEKSQPQELKKTLEAQLAGGENPAAEENEEPTDEKASDPTQVAPSMAGEIAQEPLDGLEGKAKNGDVPKHQVDDVSAHVDKSKDDVSLESWRKTERMMDETWGSGGGSVSRG